MRESRSRPEGTDWAGHKAADSQPAPNLRRLDGPTITPHASDETPSKHSALEGLLQRMGLADEADPSTDRAQSTQRTDRPRTEPAASVVDSGTQAIGFQALEAALDVVQPGMGRMVEILRRGLEAMAAINSYRAGRGFGINLPIAVSEETGFILNVRPTVAAKDWTGLPPVAFTVDWSSDSSAGPGVDQGPERPAADMVRPTDLDGTQATRSGNPVPDFLVIAPREEVGLVAGADHVDAEVLARYVQPHAAAAAPSWPPAASGDARPAPRKRRRRIDAVSLSDLPEDASDPRQRLRCAIFYLDPESGVGILAAVPVEGAPHSPILFQVLERPGAIMRLRLWAMQTTDPLATKDR